jgi:tetratricopeptide (TPR) repeat protein
MAGMLMAQGKTERAEATLEETLKSYEQLAGQFPDVLMYHLALARTQQQLAQIYADSQRTEQAKVTLDAAIGRLENLSIPGRIRNPIAMLTNRLRESRKNLGP